MKKWGPGIGVITVMLELMKEWDGLSIPPADAKFGFQLKPGEWQRAQEEHQAGLAKRMAKFTK